MTDLFGEDAGVDAFRMPGDDDWAESVAASRDAPVEAPVVETPDAPADETAETPQDRPRDEQGRFTSTDAPEEPTDGQEAAGDGEEGEGAPAELILGKYRSWEDVANAYTNAESELGRLRNELGQERAAREQLMAHLQSQQQPAPQQAQQIDVTAAREWLDENPAQIQNVLAQAFDQGNDQLVAVALRAWEATGDEVGAEQARIAVATARAARAMEQQQQAVRQQETDQQQAQRQIGQQFLAAYPDADSVAMTAAAKDNPAIGRLLAHPDPAVVTSTLETLYSLSKSGPVADTRLDATQIARDLGREQALAADQAIKDATVASATTSQTAPVKSRAEELADEWATYEAPFRDGGGWNIR